MSKRISKEEAEKIFQNNLKHIRNTLKEKIAIYEPLNFKKTYEGFIKRILVDDFKVIREVQDNSKVETYLNDLIKDFLIENAYYALADRYIKQRTMSKLGISDPHDIRLLEIVDFITLRIESDKLKKLKFFTEKSQFKTFLNLVVTRFIYDFWKEKYKQEENIKKYEPEFQDLFHLHDEDPLNMVIKLDDEELRNKAAKLLPQIIENLDSKEKLALELKYEKGMKISQIAKMLGGTFYKTNKLIKQVQEKISTEIFLGIKKINFSHLKPSNFEDLVIDLLRSLGFSGIKRERQKIDKGFDLKATYTYPDPFHTLSSDLWLVQIKFYRKSRADLASLKKFVDYLATRPERYRGLLVMNSQLTSVARKWLEVSKEKSRVEIRVIDGPDLKRLLLQNPSIVEKYFGAGQAR